MKKRIINLIKNRKLIAIVIVVILLFVFVIRPRFFASESTAESTTVKRGDIQEELVLSGDIQADEKVTLQFQTGGLLTYVGVKEGDYVEKGTHIASLDHRQLQRSLTKYLNTYKKERNDFDQTKDDNKNSVLSDTVKRAVQDAQADLDISVLDVEIQNISVQYANLYTPIEGIVTTVNSRVPGVNITAVNPAKFEIVNPRSIYFDVSADQTEIKNIREGMKGSIVFDTYPEETLIGMIQSISFSPKTDESGTVYEVKVTIPFDNASYKYRLGMTGDISFITNERKNVLHLPVAFVKSDEKGKYVFRGNNKEKIYITTGLETDTEIEIKSGLSQGDLIVE